MPKGDLSHEECSDISRTLDEFKADFSEMESRLDPLIERRLKELAGSHLDAMRMSHDAALKYLTDADPKLREAAIQVTYRRRPAAETPLGIIERMAVSDPSEDVRDTAIRALGTYYASTKDQSIGLLLATTAWNDELINGLRLTAFMALIRVHGIMDYGGNSPLVVVSLEEFDWSFVKAYLRDSPDDIPCTNR